MNRFVFLLLLSSLCIKYSVLAHGHDHDHGDHGHSHEAPHHKYSREANEGAGDQSQHTHSHSHSHGHSHDAEENTPRSHTAGKAKPKVQDTFSMWVEAIIATAIVSAAPVVILIFIPLNNANEPEHQGLLKVLLSFASGGLLGDAFLHLIPHAVNPHTHGGEEGGHGHSHEPHGHSHESHGHSHEHSHEMGVGLWVLAGIVAFLMVEKFVRYVKGGHGHSHGNSPAESPKKVPEASAGKTQKTGKKGNPSYLEELKKGKSETDKKDKGEIVKPEAAPNTGKKGNPQYLDELKAEGEIKVAGYLNLAADFAHNFTDGLAIGASFLAGRHVGIITFITILLHEVPHEIGDFAILVQSGCSKKKAMWLQLTTAVGAMMGTLCSLMAQGIGDAAVAWILPFTAGGFIYIATVSVIPELLEGEDTKLWQSVKEILALITGVLMMVLIAMYE